MATTTNFGWETPDDTDLVKDGAAAMRTLGNSIDTSFVDLKGGTTGQVLSKASSTDLDFTWVAQDDSNAIQNAIVDAKGDLISATAADTPARLAVGTNGQVLTADSTAATGLKWGTPTAGSMTLLTTTAITATNTITIGSINQTYTSLMIFVENFATTGTHNLFMRLNGDSGSNYSPAQVQGQQGVINQSGTQTSFGSVQYNNVNGTNNGSVVILIPFYSATAAYKSLTYQLSATYGGTSSPVAVNGVVAYRSTSAISSFTINTDATNFLAQGNIKIYGVN